MINLERTIQVIVAEQRVEDLCQAIRSSPDLNKGRVDLTHLFEIIVELDGRQGFYDFTLEDLKTSNEINSEVGKAIQTFSSNIPEESKKIEAIRAVYQKVLELYQVNDKIIKRLTGIAEEQGMDTVFQPETQYKVIRELFPTREAYLAYLNEKPLKIGELIQLAGSIKYNTGLAEFLRKDGNGKQMLQIHKTLDGVRIYDKEMGWLNEGLADKIYGQK